MKPCNLSLEQMLLSVEPASIMNQKGHTGGEYRDEICSDLTQTPKELFAFCASHALV